MVELKINIEHTALTSLPLSVHNVGELQLFISSFPAIRSSMPLHLIMFVCQVFLFPDLLVLIYWLLILSHHRQD